MNSCSLLYIHMNSHSFIYVHLYSHTFISILLKNIVRHHKSRCVLPKIALPDITCAGCDEVSTLTAIKYKTRNYAKEMYCRECDCKWRYDNLERINFDESVLDKWKTRDDATKTKYLTKIWHTNFDANTKALDKAIQKAKEQKWLTEKKEDDNEKKEDSNDNNKQNN